MKNQYKFLITSCLLFLLFTTSCKKEEDPRFSVVSTEINNDLYSGGGTLMALYSVDGGTTFTETMPTGLLSGSTLLVKINNGTEDLTAEYFTFDWNKSSVAPSVTDGALANFTIASDGLSIAVAVADVLDLVCVNSLSGGIFSLDLTTGDTTRVGIIKENGLPLNNIRGLVFNYNDSSLYASAQEKGSGKLYTIDPATLFAFSINNNPFDNWYGIADLLITEKNQILANLWYKDPTESGLALFDTDGTITTLSDRILFDTDICCGKGMVFGSSQSEILIANYELEIYSSTLNGTTNLITTLVPEGFDASATDLNYIKNMVKDSNGTIYCLVYDSSTATTWFAEIDISASKLTNIKLIGGDGKNLFHGLSWIPKHLFDK